jgi:leucyl/phenylalanyl-tRNA--protein transferase
MPNESMSSLNLLVPDLLIIGYRNGFFPMGDPDTEEIQWHRPDPRAVIPLDGIRISSSLRSTLRKGLYTVTVNSCFVEVITACADRPDCWITTSVIDAYTELHNLKLAHSVETWHNGTLVGGLYGVAIGGAFFGESMFSRMNDASKVSFVALVERLRERRFRLLDTQFINAFTASLGAVEIPDADYQRVLHACIDDDTSFV